MSVRDGPPLPRDRAPSRENRAPSSRSSASEIAPRVNVVGAPPLVVAAGGPGARDEVRAYAARVDAQIQKMDPIVNDWWFEREGETAPWTDAENQFNIDWPNFKIEFARWKGDIETFNVFGPSPAQAWEKTQIFENRLEDLRKRFAELAKTTPDIKAPDAPGSLEPPGGAPSGILNDEPSSGGFPWTGVLVVAGIFGVGFALSGAGRLVHG